VSDTIASDMTASAQRLEQAAADMEGGLSRTVNESLAAMDTSLEKLSAALDGISVASDNVKQAFKSVPKSASSADAYFKATAKAIDTELKLLLTAVSDTQKIFNKFNADLERRVDG